MIGADIVSKLLLRIPLFSKGYVPLTAECTSHIAQSSGFLQQ